MVDVNKAVIAHMDVGKSRFEILVDPDLAWKYKNGQKCGMERMLAVPEVYKDTKKAEKVTTHQLEEAFGTSDVFKVAEHILEKGELQLKTEQRKQIHDEKIQKIISYISRNTINPHTNAPHPMQRIETAMEEARVRIDDNKPAEEQIKDVVKKINVILPLKFEHRTIAVKIPVNYVSSCHNIAKAYGETIKEEWQNDGALIIVVKIPAGVQDEFFAKLNNLTHGNIETKLVSKE